MSLLLREDIPGYVDETTSGQPNYKFADIIETGFIDITSIENVYSFWHKCPGIDFKRARDLVKVLVTDAGGFSSLTDTQKNIACIFKIGTYSERLAFVGYSTNIQYMKAYNVNTQICREMRLFETEIIVRNELPDNHKDILNDARNALLDYKFFGVEGTPNGDNEGILDYLWGTTGTTYENTNLVSKPWVPETLSMNDLCSQLNSIISGGEYYFTMPPNANWVLI